MDSCHEPIASHVGLYQGISRYKRKKVHRLLHHSLCTKVVAEEGFEPTTFGLSFALRAKAGLRCPKFMRLVNFSFKFRPRRDSKIAPPATGSAILLFPTSHARRTHNPRASLKLISSYVHNKRDALDVLYAIFFCG